MTEDRHLIEEEDGWHFWDETGTEKYGPYADKETAAHMLRRYCLDFLEPNTQEGEDGSVR